MLVVGDGHFLFRVVERKGIEVDLVRVRDTCARSDCEKTIIVKLLLETDAALERFGVFVIEQDVDIMDEQGRSLAIDSTSNFSSTDADALHIAIERIRHYGKTDSEQLYKFQEKVEKDFWI